MAEEHAAPAAFPPPPPPAIDEKPDSYSSLRNLLVEVDLDPERIAEICTAASNHAKFSRLLIFVLLELTEAVADMAMPKAKQYLLCLESLLAIRDAAQLTRVDHGLRMILSFQY